MAGKAPPGMGLQRMVFNGEANVTATTDPMFVFTAEDGQTPLSLKFSGTTLDRTTADETYIVSLEDDGTKISTDNGAATVVNTVYEATFASKHIAAGSKVEIIFTLAGTTPILGGLTVEYTFLQG